MSWYKKSQTDIKQHAVNLTAILYSMLRELQKKSEHIIDSTNSWTMLKTEYIPKIKQTLFSYSQTHDLYWSDKKIEHLTFVLFLSNGRKFETILDTILHGIEK